MEFLYEYGLFLAKILTTAGAIVFVVGSIIGMSARNRAQVTDSIEITKLNEKFDNMRHALEASVLSKDELKKKAKQEKKEKKKSRKHTDESRGRVYVLNFESDVRGTHVGNLREEITAVLTMASSDDQVVAKVESGGGMVHAYGLGASQLDRIRSREIPLTVCVDKVAASGGYLMACVANRILAAPFAIIGSIGVIAQLPNFNKVLKKHDVEFEQITAGQYKRTLTLFGENTDKDREKMQEDLEVTHALFKDFVHSHRPEMDVERVSTGEHWLGSTALELGLVDELRTSDDLLLSLSENNDILEISYKPKQNLIQKIAAGATQVAHRLGIRQDSDTHLMM